jgi:hypothetical protein
MFARCFFHKRFFAACHASAPCSFQDTDPAAGMARKEPSCDADESNVRFRTEQVGIVLYPIFGV